MPDGTAEAVPSRLRAVNGRTISSGAEAPNMAKHLTSERKLRPHKEQSLSANRETRPPSELPASSKSARSLLRRARRRRSPWRCRASTTPFWPVIVVVSKAERPKRTRSGRNISPCSNCSPTACNPNKAAINGFEWVGAFGEGALAECSGAIGIALKDGLLHRFGKLIGHDDLASRAIWPSGIARF